ncbi:hypothetical protein MesoLjLc_17170 [Mesorhizobium sp. L-8-10]|nr:hypothetical protein MesoLjLc_17170 [Mesorhizobium sp. L-8-10]
MRDPHRFVLKRIHAIQYFGRMCTECLPGLGGNEFLALSPEKPNLESPLYHRDAPADGRLRYAELVSRARTTRGFGNRKDHLKVDQGHPVIEQRHPPYVFGHLYARRV